MEMTNIVITSDNYGKIDGRNAYKSKNRLLTLGKPTLEENKNMQIALQIWNENQTGEIEIASELPIHQVIDLMLFLSRTMLHFREAYRLPLLYDPAKPTIERLPVQGGAMPINVCVENPNINADIQEFSQALSELGELTGERLRTLS